MPKYFLTLSIAGTTLNRFSKFVSVTEFLLLKDFPVTELTVSCVRQIVDLLKVNKMLPF